MLNAIFGSTLRISYIKGFLMSYYAVARGHNVGIYDSWAKCEEQVKGFKGAKYKKFKTRPEAEAFVRSVNDIVPKEAPKDFWPEDESIEFDSFEDSDLLAAAAAAEVLASNLPGRYKRKSTADEEAEHKTKKYPVHVSNIWKPVGYKEINNVLFEIDSEDYVIVYTDGSCINNGRPDASAGLGVYFGENHPLNAALPVTGRVTNNVGEIQAAIHAIEAAKDIDIKKLCISTDSQFLINSITIWINAWKKSEWRLKTGGPVKNAVEFKVLDKLLADETFQVKWNYVKGHNSIIGNQKADKLAREGSDIYRNMNEHKKHGTF
ncbi:ribonuclease H1-like [Eurosta solidaginis]|uniref:ribonuclease H1-like n=1 Tax=Eurosta solidaginis TaxID=178769 RepID=UPI0035309987